MAFLRTGFDLVTPKGDPLHVANAALQVARHQVRLPIDDTKKGQIEGVYSQGSISSVFIPAR
jgi:hypothetical protein